MTAVIDTPLDIVAPADADTAHHAPDCEDSQASLGNPAARAAAVDPRHQPKISRALGAMTRMLRENTNLIDAAALTWWSGYKAAAKDAGVTLHAAYPSPRHGRAIIATFEIAHFRLGDGVPMPVAYTEVWRAGYRAGYIDHPRTPDPAHEQLAIACAREEKAERQAATAVQRAAERGAGQAAKQVTTVDAADSPEIIRAVTGDLDSLTHGAHTVARRAPQAATARRPARRSTPSTTATTKPEGETSR